MCHNCFNMKNTQKGFVAVLVLVIAALGLAGAGGYYFVNQNKVATDARVETDLKNAAETASTTGKGSVVTVGHTEKTNIPININVSAGVDHNGQKTTKFTVDEEVMNKAAGEKYGSNSVAINRQIRTQIQSVFSNFAVNAVSGPYEKVCVSAKIDIEAGISKSIKNNENFFTAMGISMSSFRTKEIICKSNNDGYILTIPLTLEDGTPALVCDTKDVFGGVSDVNYSTYTCTQK